MNRWRAKLGVLSVFEGVVKPSLVIAAERRIPLDACPQRDERPATVTMTYFTRIASSRPTRAEAMMSESTSDTHTGLVVSPRSTG